VQKIIKFDADLSGLSAGWLFLCHPPRRKGKGTGKDADLTKI